MELLHRDGLLAISGIVDKDHLVKLRDSMLATAKEIKASKTKLTDYVSCCAVRNMLSKPLTSSIPR